MNATSLIMLIIFALYGDFTSRLIDEIHSSLISPIYLPFTRKRMHMLSKLLGKLLSLLLSLSNEVTPFASSR